MLNVTGTGDATVGAELVASLDGGVSWSALSAGPAAASVRAGRWIGQRTIGDLDLAVGTTVRFGLRVSRVGAPGGATIADSTCNLRVRIGNRNGAASPFDAEE